jgi:hypothetical protein
MNKKLIWGIVIVIVVIGGIYFAFRPLCACSPEKIPVSEIDRTTKTDNNTVASPTPVTETSIEKQPLNRGTTLKLISPNGGESWSVGKTFEIKWSAPTDSTQIRIYLIDDRTGSRQAEPLLIANVSAQIGKYSWIVPSTIVPNKATDKGTFKIEIEETSLRGYTDSSDNYFNITN